PERARITGQLPRIPAGAWAAACPEYRAKELEPTCGARCSPHCYETTPDASSPEQDRWPSAEGWESDTCTSSSAFNPQSTVLRRSEALGCGLVGSPRVGRAGSSGCDGVILLVCLCQLAARQP